VATIDLFQDHARKRESCGLWESTLVRTADSNKASEKPLNTPRVRNHQLEAANGQVWGRPVGVAIANDGSLFVTDDGSRSVWHVTYVGM